MQKDAKQHGSPHAQHGSQLTNTTCITIILFYIKQTFSIQRQGTSIETKKFIYFYTDYFKALYFFQYLIPWFL